MKHILVPTDFSKPAENAFQYVKAMSQDLESKITVLHTYHPTVDANRSFMAIPIEELSRQRKMQLQNFVEDSTEEDWEEVVTDQMINQQLELGFAAEQIVERSKSGEFQLIVMGTSGQGGLLSKVFGSVSTQVVKKSVCPVWLVPPNARYQKIKNILYASNYDSSDREMVQEVLTLANDFDANIHFVHVNEKKKKGDYELEQILLEQIFRKEAPSLEFRVSTVQSDTVWEGLYRYAADANIDLIVLATRQRPFLDDLFHKSITKMMVLKDQDIPLLVLHSAAK